MFSLNRACIFLKLIIMQGGVSLRKPYSNGTKEKGANMLSCCRLQRVQHIWLLACNKHLVFHLKPKANLNSYRHVSSDLVPEIWTCVKIHAPALHATRLAALGFSSDSGEKKYAGNILLLKVQFQGICPRRSPCHHGYQQKQALAQSSRTLPGAFASETASDFSGNVIRGMVNPTTLVCWS